MKVLVVGGTGPTGPHVVQGLLNRGHDVTLFHRGVHEPPGLPEVRHIHGDPHFRETIEEALSGEQFDVVACMYGRVKTLAEWFAKRCEQFVAVGGVPSYKNVLGWTEQRPPGAVLPTREDGPLADTEGEASSFAGKVLAAEREVLDRARDGDFRGTVIRYPAIHGPRNQTPHEWMVLKRMQDRRPFMILPDGGLGILGRCGARNAAEVLLRCIDRPEAADGEAFNAADDTQYSWRQWVDVVAGAAGGSIEVASLPAELAGPVQASLIPLRDYSPQTLFDTTKAKTLLGYQEVLSAEDQIRETVAWLQETPPDVDSQIAFVDTFSYDREDTLVAAYRKAVEEVRETAGWDAPALHHPLPHPKKAGLGPDEMGR
ncbi:NAD-dependent epimerase/dehydratase family protein [Streptomyces sp. NPDC047453]|uniref:NAD-dependent epimerase/dehydratase family protein n=1 Tax=Streptomyces sp. NPDC047453 TaxID=3154812 RepID=UPI0033C98ECD